MVVILSRPQCVNMRNPFDWLLWTVAEAEKCIAVCFYLYMPAIACYFLHIRHVTIAPNTNITWFVYWYLVLRGDPRRVIGSSVYLLTAVSNRCIAHLMVRYDFNENTNDGIPNYAFSKYASQFDYLLDLLCSTFSVYAEFTVIKSWIWFRLITYWIEPSKRRHLKNPGGGGGGGGGGCR